MRIPRLVSTLLRTSCTKWNLTTGTDHTAQRALLSGMSNALVRSEPLSSGNKSFLELDRALQQADKIVGNSASSNSLQHHLNEEVSVVTEILQRLVGTNHSLSAIEKLYQNGSNSDHLLRGLSVLLVSKAGASSKAVEDSTEQQQRQHEITQDQLVLAKVVEMINMAMLIHKEICNIDSLTATATVEGSQIHLNNKISVLYGDFMWAKAWKDLADLHQIEVTDMMVSVLVNTTQGQFVSEEELTDVSTKLNLEYWLEKNFLLSACLPAFGCKSVLKLAQIDESLQNHGYQFGQNLGYYIKAHQEIQWFLNNAPNPREVLDFCSLPVVMHSMESGGDPLLSYATRHPPNKDSLSELKLAKYNYADLHSLVRSGPALSKAKTVLEMFRANAFTNLNHFPHSEARDCLKKILSAMNV